MLNLDHIIVSAIELGAGVRWIEEALGVPMAPGGRHPDMGTHNHLLSLGPDCYLEVIAIDPKASAPARPRWFSLDQFTGAPRLTNWAINWPSGRDLPPRPEGTGPLMALHRGEYHWRMTVPEDGNLPFDNMSPGLLIWDCADRPADALPDQGCRLVALDVEHPDAVELANYFERDLAGQGVTFIEAAVPKLSALIETPSGMVRL